MGVPELCLAGVVAVVAGLDRTAMLQVMMSRPLVVAPVVGLLFGCPEEGLQIGLMCELLWLGRLPVGAAIPPDDTQVAIGATTLVAIQGPVEAGGLPLALLCLLVAIPLGKAGQIFDLKAREWNGRLQQRWDVCLDAGDLASLERIHLRGVLHFAIASIGTFLVVVSAGSLLVETLKPMVLPMLIPVAGWLRLSLVAIGVAAIVGSLNVGRTLTLFCASFLTGLMVLWLV